MRLFSCLLLIVLFTAGCANIVPLTGGKKDTTPPKLLGVVPKDSLLNERVTRVEMQFDEFVALDDAANQIQMSPVLPFPLTSVVVGKKVRVDIPDSLLKENTTYRLSFGSAIKDLHENNPFKGYEYIFSTGSYFDSMQLNGYVVDAATGKPADGVRILLYDGEASDSAVVRKKPDYVFTTSGGGKFVITGLPGKKFKVYALADENENLVYDGEDERIGFVDSIFITTDSLVAPIEFRIFKEVPVVDTSLEVTQRDRVDARGKRKNDKENQVLRYGVNIDTSNVQNRTFDINKPVKITYSTAIDTYDLSKISLSYDTTEIKTDFTVTRDTSDKVLLVSADWKPNTFYTLKLLKGFATDTAEVTSLPSKYMFTTKSEDDYGIIHVNIPQKFNDKKFLLLVTSEEDTTYKEPIVDTTFSLKRLMPGKYALWIIVDENGNGKWDTGDLFAKKQPEVVLPHNADIQLKAGWENVIDFTEPLHEEPKKEKDKEENENVENTEEKK